MSVVSLENGSDNMCVDCEVRHLKLKSKGSVSVVSLNNCYELRSIVLVSCKYVKIMSVVSLKNLGQLQGIALIVTLVKLSRKENTSMGL